MSMFSVLTLTLLLMSCGSENPLISPIKKGINSQDYQTALAMADTAIAKDPTNGLPYYYKADIYGRLADAEPDVFKRKALYENMHKNIAKAQELFAAMETPPAESKKIADLVLPRWGTEHNKAIAYVNDDSVKASVSNPLDYSIAHLVNATTVNPDSAFSFEILAQIYQMNGDYAEAAQTLKQAMSLREVNDAATYDRLSSYYFMLEDYPNAEQVVEEGLELYPDSVFLIQKLADAYFQTGKTETAIEVVNSLIERDPENPQYYLVVGTQIYQQVQNLTDELQANNDRLYEIGNDDGKADEIAKLTARNKEILEQTENLVSRAESSLLKAAELDPTNFTTFNTLGVLYQNKAAALFDQRNATTDNEEAARFDELAKAEAEKALVYYEKAAEIQPDNKTIWETLFRIYTLLDYREKAEAAMEKAGM